MHLRDADAGDALSAIENVTVTVQYYCEKFCANPRRISLFCAFIIKNSLLLIDLI